MTTFKFVQENLSDFGTVSEHERFPECYYVDVSWEKFKEFLRGFNMTFAIIDQFKKATFKIKPVQLSGFNDLTVADLLLTVDFCKNQLFDTFSNMIEISANQIPFENILRGSLTLYEPDKFPGSGKSIHLMYSKE